MRKVKAIPYPTIGVKIHQEDSDDPESIEPLEIIFIDPHPVTKMGQKRRHSSLIKKPTSRVGRGGFSGSGVLLADRCVASSALR